MSIQRICRRARSLRWVVCVATVVGVAAGGLSAIPAVAAGSDASGLVGEAGPAPAAEFPEPMPLSEDQRFYIPPPQPTVHFADGVAPLPPMAVAPVGPPASRPNPVEFDGTGAARELPGERSENVDVYANPDGTRTARVYAGPVNWKDGTGKWQKIDERLVADGEWYRNTSGPFTARFAAMVGTGPVAKIDKGGSSVSFGAPAGTPKGIKAEVDGSKVTYREVMPGIDLVYLVTVSEVKELFVLHRKPNANATFRFPITTSNVSVAARDGGLDFRDAQGSAMAVAPVGEMWDSVPGEGPVAPVRHRLEKVGAAQFVMLDFDAAYVNDPARVYPVYIDPSLALTGGDDAFVSSEWPTNNYNVSLETDTTPDHYQDKVGTFNEDGVNAGQNHSFLRYDVSSLAGKTVQYSRWHGYFFWSYYPTTRTTYRLRALSTEWTAGGVTWDNQPVPRNEDIKIDSAHRDEWRDIDITDWVTKWKTGYWRNDGLMIDTGTTLTSDWKKLSAHEDCPNPQTGQCFRSYLEVVYTATPPTAPTLVAPADNLITQSSPSRFEAIRHDADGDVGSVSFQVRRTSDGVVVASETIGNVGHNGTAAWTDPPALPDGHYTWEAQASDATSWGPWSASRAFRVDDTDPTGVTNLQSTTHSTTAPSTNPSITFTWDAATDSGAGVAGYSYSLATSSTEEAPTSQVLNTTRQQTVNAPEDGQYWFNVRAVDYAGNWGPNTRVGPYTITTARPVVEKTANVADALRGDVVTYTVTVTNPNPWGIEDVTLADTLDAELATVAGSVETAKGQQPPTACVTPACTLTSQSVAVGAFDLAANESLTLTYQAVALGVDRGCAIADNTATVGHEAGGAFDTVSVNVCGGGLGFEPWWNLFSRPTGADSTAHVNPANGNLVLHQSDATDVQGHGRLGLGLRRTYNSQGTGGIEGPGSVGRGWTLNVAAVGDLTDGVMPTALSVPVGALVANPTAVFLVDRDGTRHAFTHRLVAPIDLAAPGVPSALDPKALVVPAGKRVCLQDAYDPPPGVHLSLWRYVGVDETSSCGALAQGGGNPVVLGFVAVRPDRLRMEFSAAGQLVSMLDGAGNELRYRYATDGSLEAVYEPSTCSSTEPVQRDNTSCRRLWFENPSTTERRITDSAGREVRLFFDDAVSKRLIRAETWVGGVKVQQNSYSYGTCDGAGPDQLCRITDARGANTDFTYQSSVAGARRVASLTERGTASVTVGSRPATTFAYDDGTNTVTADTAGRQRTRWEGIDGAGRVARVLAGNVDDEFIHVQDLVWDRAATPSAPGVTCREPDQKPDNNLCQTTQEGGVTVDLVTTYVYNAEGRLKRERKANEGVNIDATLGYKAQYFQADGSVATYLDTVGWGGAVPSQGGPSRADPGGSPTLFVLSDLSESLTPEGNSTARASAAGVAGSWTRYRTTHVVDANPGAEPSTTPTGLVCAAGGPSFNTGLTCETQAPLGATTHYTYDAKGQRATATTPKAHEDNVAADARCAALGAPRQCVSYTYFSDADKDLSNKASAAGWLRTVTDQDNNFVAFGYDRAGNPARTWDRNATEGKQPSAYPGTLNSTDLGAFRETLRGTTDAYARPWRHVLSEKTPSGSVTQNSVDANGNIVFIRAPRLVSAGRTDKDHHMVYDSSDRLMQSAEPEDRGDGVWTPDDVTAYAYDPFGNLVRTIDPRGVVVVDAYDDVNRRQSTTWTRGPWPSNPQDVPDACSQTVTGDLLPAGRMKCSRGFTYDSADNVVEASDGNGVVTRQVFDAVGRLKSRYVPRVGTTEMRTDTVYDLDGRVLRVCPPREFTLGSNSCGATARYAVHSTYDELGRSASQTTYRDNTGSASTTSWAYDADGNAEAVMDPNSHTTTAVYSLLGRKASETVPRDATTSFTTTYAYDPSGNTTSVVRPPAIDSGTAVDGDVVIDGVQYPAAAPYTLADGKDFKSLTLVNGGWIAAPADGTLSFKVRGALSVCATCGITANGGGLAGGGAGTSTSSAAGGGSGPGGGAGGGGSTGTGGGGGGGGHATAGSQGGGASGGAGGPFFGTADQWDGAGNANLALGSGGGGGGRGGATNGASGGAGGGVIQINAESVDIQGAITANGAPGAAALLSGGGGGGGSGGAVWLTAITGAFTGSLTAAGGAGGLGGSAGGNGAPGYIRVDSDGLAGTLPAGTFQRTVARIDAYSFDLDNRLIDSVVGASSPNAAEAGVADGGRNTRTRRVYDLDSNLVGYYEPHAFTGSTTNPDERYLSRAEYDFEGRLTATYTPRYDDTAAPDLALSTTQTSQCPTSVRPELVPGVDQYPASVGLCRTRYSYDLADNLTVVRFPTSTSDSDARFVSWTYTDDNLVTKVSAPAPVGSGVTRAETTTVFDGEGRPFRQTDPEGEATVTDYLLDGLVKKVTEQQAVVDGTTINHVTTFGYNADGQQNAVTVVDTNQTAGQNLTAQSVFYNDGLLKSVADPAGNTTLYEYDLAGNSTVVKSPRASAGDEPPVLNTYTHDNLLATTTTPTRNDGVNKTVATQSRRTTFTYDRGGRTIAQAVDRLDGIGAVTATSGRQAFAYSPNDRLVRETGRDGTAITYQHDAAGNATQIVDPTSGGSTLNATYYLDGLARTVDLSGGRTTKNTYDGGGQRVARADTNAGGQYLTKYTYGDAGEQASLTSDLMLAGSTSWTYFADGNVKRETAGNSQTVDYSYHADDTLATQVLKDPGGTALATWSYKYDQLYRIKSETFTGTSASTGAAYQGQTAYAYDRGGRLDNFTLPNKPMTDLTWDADDNRLTMGPNTFTYNPDDSIDTSTKQGDPTRQYVYKPFGGLETDACSAYSYDPFDRLAQVSAGAACAGTPTTTYAYDALDRQRSRVEGTVSTAFHYDGAGSDVAVSVEAGVDTAYVLDAGGEAKLAKKLTPTPTTNYLVADGQGNTATATNPSGAVRCTARFDPYGAPLDASGNEIAGANPCNSGSTVGDVFYQGGRRDKTTGNYQFGSRTYDPAKASFLTPDSYRSGGGAADLSIGLDPMTMNRYSYVNGDPVNLVDPSGHGPMYRDTECGPDSCGPRANAAVEEVRQTSRNLHRHGEYGHESMARTWAPEPVKAKKEPLWKRGLKLAATIGAGALAYAGCSATTLGAGTSNVCIVAAGAAAGAVNGLLNCGDGNKLACAGKGAVSGGAGAVVFLATGGASAGASVLAVVGAGAAAGGAATAVDQAFTGDFSAEGIVQGAVIGGVTAGAVKALPGAVKAVRGRASGAAPVAGAADDLAMACRTNSFVPATLVLMAGGTSKPIADVAIGDMVMATDPETGERGARRVIDTIVGDGIKELVDIEIEGDVITATDRHPFWVDDEGRWVDAEDLDRGDVLLLADGDIVKVGAVRERTEVRRVHNLTVDGIHTYYVLAGDDPVLVHNCVQDVIDETVTGRGNLTSKHVLSADDALTAGQQWVGPGYREVGTSGSGVFRSADNLRQFRMDASSLTGSHPPGVPHVHFERFMPGVRRPFVNNHVPFQ